MVDMPARASDVLDRASSWWVAQIRPQYEEKAAEDIRKAGKSYGVEVVAFVPREEYVTERTDKLGHIRTVTNSRPIFPQYCLYAGERDLAFESAAVLKVLKTTSRDCRDIENLYLASQSGQVRRATIKGLEVGVPVKIVAGPFRGREGVVMRFGDTRVVLRVGTLGGAEFTTKLQYIEPLWGD